MKKFISFILVSVMLFSMTTAIAESHATPYIGLFATMKTKTNDNYIEITFNKPIDRLFVNWRGKGETLEELALTDDCKATVLTTSHKYMPGVPYNNSGRVGCVSDYIIIPLLADKCAPENEKIIKRYNDSKDFNVISVMYPTVNPKDNYVELINGYIVVLPVTRTSAHATPSQVAYITLQGDWVVSYSRNGTILKIEYNEEY